MEIIGEIGLNHGGSYNKAVEMLQALKGTGVGIAKFQFYYTDTICINRNCFSSYILLDKIRMRPQWIPLLAEECKRLRLEFLCTSFCVYSAEAIASYVERFKIASPEAADIEFVKAVASYGKPLIISTGKAGDRELDEIFSSVTVPVTLLYCKSLYPATPADYDLNEIDRLRNRYHCKVGLSCHCAGIKNAIDAVKLHGADMLEKHFMIGDCIDKAVSINPETMKKLMEVLHGKR